MQFPIVSKAFYRQTLRRSQLNAPLGSGAYKVGRVVAGPDIELSASPTIGGATSPSIAASTISTDPHRVLSRRQAGFEAFKKGEVLFREEFTAAGWATGYDFPALAAEGRQARVSGELRPSMQAVAVNQRRENSAIRACAARSLCASTSNGRSEKLFYGSYERSQSAFERSAYKAEGMPSPEELALLEPFRGKISAAAFGEAVMQPVSDGSGRDRKLLGEAIETAGRRGLGQATAAFSTTTRANGSVSKSWATTTCSPASIRHGSRT